MGIEDKRWVDGGGSEDDRSVWWVVVILTALALAFALGVPLPEHG